MYGLVQQYLRLPEDQVVYSKKHDYIYVNHGFFQPRPFQFPYPLLFFLSTLSATVAYPYGIYRFISAGLWTSWIVNFWYGTWGGLAVTAGVHRLWCHKSYKASLPLRVFLMLGQTMTGQSSLYGWAIGHRVHHKYSDTDGDPHNTKRGFVFAHAGWLFVPEHPDVHKKEKLYNYDDLLQDPVVSFQLKYFIPLYALMTFIIPVSLQMWLAGDNIFDAILFSVIMRNWSVYNDTAFVNSAAHMFGDKPYNEEIVAVENYYVSLASFGEGYHNYHHTFPFDYKASEHGVGFNFTTKFLDLMWHFGQTFDMKSVPQNLVDRKKLLASGHEVDVKDIPSEEEQEMNADSKPHVAHVIGSIISNVRLTMIQAQDRFSYFLLKKKEEKEL